MFHSIKLNSDSSNTNSSTRSAVGVRSSENSLFEETAYVAIKKANRRKWTFIGAVVAIIAFGIASVFLYNANNARERDLTTVYLTADKLFQAELEAFRTKAQEAGSQLDPFSMPMHNESTQKFADFAKQNLNHPLGWLAAIRASEQFIRQENYEAAITLLEPLVKKTLAHRLIQMKVRRSLAGLYVEKSKFNLALKHLQYLEKMPDLPNLSEIRLFKAKILHLAGEQEESLTLLKSLAEETNTIEPSAREVALEASQLLGHWGSR